MAFPRIHHRSFGDELLPNPTILHAIHSLPFLVENPKAFRNAACVIYSNEQTQGTIFASLHLIFRKEL